LQESNRRAAQLSDEQDRWIAMWRQLSSPEFPYCRVWEDLHLGGFKLEPPTVNRPEHREPLNVTLDDPLCFWLWKHAWNACAETGSWDLLTTAAGIARAIRTEGVPLSDALTATASPYKGSE
jgi:hypothetical protein